jgi:Tetratricopeptide repeat
MWQPIRFLLAKLLQYRQKNRRAEQQPSEPENDVPDRKPLQANLETAIFAKEPRAVFSQSIRVGPPPLDERNLQEQITEAVDRAMHSLDIRGRLLDRDHILQMAIRLNDQAVLEKDRGRYQLAEALIRKSLDIFEKIAVPDHPELVAILKNYADLLRRADREPEAIPLEARAASIRAGWPEDGVLDTRIQRK